MILPTSKGALLILLWSTLMFIYIFFMLGDHAVAVLHLSITCMYFIAILTFFVVGLVADTCVGRYKVIVGSIYCAFVGWICLCISFFITHKLVLQTFGLVVGCIGAAGVVTISIPFNIDQLVGASADELSIVIYWHVFGFPLGNGLARSSYCLVTNKLYHQSVSLCVSGVAVTIVMVTYYLLKHHLDTTPLLTNPIKLIFKVLNYARKNKYPRLRSAMTYWEESAPSRLDLGKEKYGGPFTEEEVEDVKTVLRFCPLMACISLFTIATIVPRSLHHINITEHCAYESTPMVSLVAILLIMLLHKMFFSRFCHKCIPSMLKRIWLGLCILLFALLVYIPIDIVNYKAVSNCTTTYEGSTTNYIFLLSFKVLSDIGGIVIAAVSLELTVAQSPVNMRGLMVGLWYCCAFISILLSYAVHMSLKQVHSHCALYYHVTVVVCVILVIAIYCVLARYYKLRVRNEVYNIHHVVATTYDRYIQQSDEYRQLNSSELIIDD